MGWSMFINALSICAAEITLTVFQIPDGYTHARVCLQRENFVHRKLVKFKVMF